MMSKSKRLGVPTFFLDIDSNMMPSCYHRATEVTTKLHPGKVTPLKQWTEIDEYLTRLKNFDSYIEEKVSQKYDKWDDKSLALEIKKIGE